MNSMNDSGVVAGPASGQTSHTHRLRRLAVTGFIGALAADAKTTLDVYGHMWPDKDEASRAAVAAAIAARPMVQNASARAGERWVDDAPLRRTGARHLLARCP